jgi:hypothetical protein
MFDPVTWYILLYITSAKQNVTDTNDMNFLNFTELQYKMIKSRMVDANGWIVNWLQYSKDKPRHIYLVFMWSN